jgi:ClpP class serine protease
MLACATNYIEATETAQIGNIGAIMTWDDYTKYDQQRGIEEKAIYNDGATLKSTFHTAPNDEQIAFLQDTVNQHGKIFNSFVKSQRSVDDEVFKAGWYYGEKALQLGLIDKIKD